MTEKQENDSIVTSFTVYDTQFACCDATEKPCKTQKSQQTFTLLPQKRLTDNLEDKNSFYVMLPKPNLKYHVRKSYSVLKGGLFYYEGCAITIRIPAAF